MNDRWEPDGDCTVEELGSEDIPLLHGFLAAYDALFPVPLTAKTDLCALSVKLLTYGNVFAIRRGEKLISLVAGYTEHTENDLGYVSVVLTAPGEQGKGYAAILLRHFIALAFSKGLSGVHLYTLRTNERAVRLYRSCGFINYELEDEPRKNDLHLIRLPEE